VSDRLHIQRAARADLKAAFQWYESQESGLGGRLLDSVKAELQRIVENPEAFPVRFDVIRRAIVDTFPYGIFSVSEKMALSFMPFITPRAIRRF
jgi:plasmid stabilization system protein ParE